MTPETEARALRTGAALIDRTAHGRLRLTGADRLDLLHRTTTGALKGLSPGGGARTILQTETAKVIDWLTVLNDASESLLLTAPGLAAEVAGWIDRIVIMDDVVVEDLSGATAQLELCGAGAAALLERLVGPELPAALSAPGTHRVVDLGGTTTRIFAARTSDPRAFGLLVPAAAAAGLTARLEAAGAVPVSIASAEALRVELGIPAVGHELTRDANPLEARLHTSIAFDKGCYTGQEVIAKMITYKSTKRTLIGLRLSAPLAPPAAWHWHPLRHDDEVVGRLTSVVWSPLLGTWIGLGTVRNEVAVPGTRLRAEAAGYPVGGGPKLGTLLPAEAPAVDLVTAALPFDVPAVA